MRSIEVYTLQAVEAALKTQAKMPEWYVLRFSGFVFKIYGKWAQLMQTPTGLRDSGSSAHKSARSLVSEILGFISANAERAE